MQREYEVTRVKEQIKHLERDLETAEHDKTRAVRDEEFEVSKVRDQYKSKVSRIDDQITRIQAEIRSKMNDLKRFETELEASKNAQPSAAELDREQRAEHRKRYQ